VLPATFITDISFSTCRLKGQHTLSWKGLPSIEFREGVGVGPFDRALVSLPGKERMARTMRGPAYIHATAVDTAGAIGMWDVVVPPGKGPTRHTHTREVEVFRVIDGTFRFWCGEEQFDAPAGTTVTLPPHVAHHWRNIGDTPGRLFAIVAPGGFEQFFLEIDRMGAQTLEQAIAIQEPLGVIEATAAEQALAETRHATEPQARPEPV
jgi:quercetin dioxygenase-like cupin family protein